SDSHRRQAEARAMADSGIAYAAAMLSNPDTFTNTLNSNPLNNAGVFQGQLVLSGARPELNGRFSLVAPLNPGESQAADGSMFRYGVIDESGKINLNSLLKWDPTGQKGHDLLMLLPNMTEDIA